MNIRYDTKQKELNKKVKNKRLKFRFSEDLMLIKRKRLGLIYTRYVANVAAGGVYTIPGLCWYVVGAKTSGLSYH